MRGIFLKSFRGRSFAEKMKPWASFRPGDLKPQLQVPLRATVPPKAPTPDGLVGSQAARIDSLRLIASAARFMFSRTSVSSLVCACGYRADDEGGVYNLLPAKLRAELYPGDRADAIDFSLPGHEARLARSHPSVEVVRLPGATHTIHDEIAFRDEYLARVRAFV